MLRRTYDRLMREATRPGAERALAAVSFAESSFFPIPPDVMIVPMVLANPERAWRIATIATIASVVGGMLGYAIGYFLFETLGNWVFNLYGLQEKANAFQASYQEWGLWIILIKGLTPIPYKLVTIASGAAHFSLAVFTVASIITRGARFFLLAALLRRFGLPIRDFIERRLTLVTSAFAGAIVLGFVALRWI
ncbi:MAG TPA: YqaA family protein [Geminicoccus sp.]|uniref:YqaA family protein n=1 Tax=Geminicoccus sp. TaxID=2024832 RepID=UPI002E309EA1|nr:YqaA family protein [Geminicoccus sp.]HEX2524754.1 YqaA family protein [Geminicoccus sp.]